jgi:hypothetical protein
MECGGELVPSYAEGTPLSYGEARLASEEQRVLLLRVLSFSQAADFNNAISNLKFCSGILCALGASAVNRPLRNPQFPI